jgi:DNA replication licensing factor MCM5
VRLLQKAELHSAEEQILRRIPIGGYVPEKAVVEQLSRLGMDQAVVRRACVYLVQREVLEYKKERRILHRCR